MTWNGNRLAVSLRLLRAVNVGRARASRNGGEWPRIAEARLQQWDADCRARVDARQLSIFDAMST